MFAFLSDFLRHFDLSDRSVKLWPRDSSYYEREIEIQFNPTLIESLKKDHKKLIKVFGQIWTEGFEKKDHQRLAQLVTEFKSGFQSHLLKENVKFYRYLEQSLAHDPHSLQVFKEIRNDMNHIADTVVSFCKKFSVDPFSWELAQAFEKDYVKVGEILTRRVSMEENELFLLYQSE